MNDEQTERLITVLERIAVALEVANYRAAPPANAAFPAKVVSGNLWQCGVCKNWVLGTMHTCFAAPHSSYHTPTT